MIFNKTVPTHKISVEKSSGIGLQQGLGSIHKTSAEKFRSFGLVQEWVPSEIYLLRNLKFLGINKLGSHSFIHLIRHLEVLTLNKAGSPLLNLSAEKSSGLGKAFNKGGFQLLYLLASLKSLEV